MDPKIYYTNRLDTLQGELEKLKKKKSVFGILRFGTVAAIIAVFYFLWVLGVVYVFIAAIILLITFIFLVYKDLSNKAAIRHHEYLVNINEDEISAINGEYDQFADGGLYLPKDHLYAADIDILGDASLYQFLNRTTSDLGGLRLATWLLDPAQTDDLLLRQAAIKEVSKKILWRQELQAFGMVSKIKETTFLKLRQWLLEPTLFYQFKAWQWLRFILPFIILSIVTAAILSWIPLNIMYLSLLIFAIIAYQVNRMISPIHDKLSKMVEEMDVLSQSIAIIEKESFDSALLLDLQNRYYFGKKTASTHIRSLKQILDKLDIRYNIVISAPLNLLLLWNLQQVLNLEKWKVEHAADVERWFQTLGEIEALNSFGTAHFNNPDWCFPQFSKKYFSFQATELGHPLINNFKRVNNFIKINTAGELMLVTGSNMAGKSTYLRSVGVNIVLAMAGAPVCAATFTISRVQLLTWKKVHLHFTLN